MTWVWQPTEAETAYDIHDDEPDQKAWREANQEAMERDFWDRYYMGWLLAGITVVLAGIAVWAVWFS